MHMHLEELAGLLVQHGHGLVGLLVHVVMFSHLLHQTDPSGYGAGDVVPGKGGHLPLVNDEVSLIDHKPDQARVGEPHIPPLPDVLLFEHHGEDILQVALYDTNSVLGTLGPTYIFSTRWVMKAPDKSTMETMIVVGL
jgi:hypothetical protein